ncbi:uncharacterized protein [Anabrus simplex]|uniref:uncharacterized protein n=1 Tax=Anabrus simplex TaxID=316456 RepID=UPI0035A3AB75
MAGDGQDVTPPIPSWLNKDFVQKALRSGDNNPTLTVLSCEVSMANSVGDGYSCDMYRIIARLEGSQERRVIVKCHPQGGYRESMLKKGNIFDIETRMLQETLPAMYKLLNDAKPGVYQPFAAKCVYHGNDPIQFIVLEDLRHSGFTLAKRYEGLDLTHCTMVLKALARYHAASIGLHNQNPSAVESYNKCFFNEELKDDMIKFFDNGIRCLSEAASQWPGFEKYACKLKKLESKYYDKIVEITKRKDDDFNVLLHGDTWTNNIMFKYADCVLEDLRFVDFQLVHYSSPGLDLQYFLYACTNQEIRMNYVDKLIEEYHSTLVETLEILGCSHRSVPLAVIRKAFDDCAFYGFMAATAVLPIVLSKPEDGLDMDEVESEDWPERQMKIYTNEAYVSAIKSMLPLFEEKGLLDC